MSDTNDFPTSYQNHQLHQKAIAEANAVNRATVFDALASAGITTVTVNFDGEGDSGQIDDITVLANENPAQLPATTISYRHPNYGVQEPTTSTIPLSEAIENLCYDFLEIDHGGWEINDGSFGDFTFDVAERQIDLAFNARFSDFTTSSYTF